MTLLFSLIRWTRNTLCFVFTVKHVFSLIRRVSTSVKWPWRPWRSSWRRRSRKYWILRVREEQRQVKDQEALGKRKTIPVSVVVILETTVRLQLPRVTWKGCGVARLCENRNVLLFWLWITSVHFLSRLSNNTNSCSYTATLICIDPKPSRGTVIHHHALIVIVAPTIRLKLKCFLMWSNQHSQMSSCQCAHFH